MSETGKTGGCQCGAIRYRIDTPLEHGHICHCRMCQKATGNYFLPVARTATTGVSITRGEPGWFQSSGTVRRGFCAACGTPLFYDLPGYGAIQVALGSLDDPASVELEFQSGTESRMPWFDRLAALPDSPASEKWYAKIAAAAYQHPDHDTDHWPPEDRS